MKGLTIAACLLLGGFVAARAVLVPLTYDEAASYLRYISQDFLAVFNFEVATNHFLNTLPTKLVSIIAGDSELALRLPSLAGYGLYLSFSVLILRSISERPVAIAGFVLLNLNPYLLDYFALSRGYGLSLGCLMGALFFFLRFASRRVSCESGNTDAGRALMFGCAAVLAGFSLLDAYLGIFAVMVVTAWATRAAAHQGAEKSRFAGLFLFTTAALFTFLVLSQDHRLTERLYEPVTIGFAGLDQSELDAITVSRINLRQRPEAVARVAGGSVWRVDSVATRGLRVEMPATAAAKIRDGRALVETIVGSRPFVQRGGEGDVWSLRDTGDTVVFENGPALSLQRSRMGLYKPVINWRGDSRHLGWVAAYTTAAMALLAGLAMLLTIAGWAAGRLRVLTAGEWRPMMFGLLWVAALAGPPLYLLRRGEELYFGGMRGFVEDTIYSLIESSFYGRTYFTSQAEFVFGAIGVTIAAFGIVAYLGWRRQTVRHLPAAWMLGVLVVASAAVILQNWLLNAPFLLGRTALFYIPGFVLFATFLGDAMTRVGKAARTLTVCLSVAAAALAAAHFAATANVSHTWDWRKDAGTKAMIDDLAWLLNEERVAESRVVLGVEPNYSAAAAFYAQRCRSATIEMDTIPSPRAVDFFYVDERNVGSLTVVKRYPVANSVLARPVRREK